ncbi:hypothetical protein E2562_030641 [Oryza meyeriana var. granulata]|uniref:Uncharacterized protein n=1 Tax=Oryza meyeriana var. granulata TaxID=110450 RepID=A0A6G1C1G2_9ORYZ|nr:hypothetical protein E2562_030641 [Oryza meyeriana var. granulata]
MEVLASSPMVAEDAKARATAWNIAAGNGGNDRPALVGPWEMVAKALPATVKLKAVTAQQGAASSDERWLEAARHGGRWISCRGVN